MEAVPVIAIDGPSGSGKGTVSRLVARRLGWHLLDSGALYRLVGLAALRRGLPLDDAEALGRLARELPAAFREDPASGELRVLLEGEDVTEALRGEGCAAAASRVAALPPVREALLERQRAFRRPPGLVADGRDMGTVVFPDAPLKVFLTASREARALRRYKQLKEQGADVRLGAILEELAERDARDSTRSISPLRPAPDAVTVDTTGLSVEQVVERVLALWRERSGPSGAGGEGGAVEGSAGNFGDGGPS
ncbi:MAG: (d)CMP kinase [Gammaproteobacteria bacterium]|nr:MAG: (d)CMP kinase [Gammaproteobacteria bacterium]